MIVYHLNQIILIFVPFCFGADNNILFEKTETKILNPAIVSYADFEMKSLAPNVYKMNLTVVATHPLNHLWVHYVLNRKTTTYHKYLIDLWEGRCLRNADGTDNENWKGKLHKIWFSL